jgi:hypothetical protein
MKQNEGADMKRRLRACFLVAAGLSVIPVQDVTAQTKRVGIGSTSCAQFLDLYRDSPEDIEAVFYSWAMGVMSGLNLSLREERADLMPHTFDGDAQMKHIRHFCEARPSALYVTAVRDLYATLRSKQSLPPWRFSRYRNK